MWRQFGFYAKNFFSPFISFTSNNRAKRTRNLSLCTARALDLCLYSQARAYKIYVASRLRRVWCEVGSEGDGNLMPARISQLKIFLTLFFISQPAHHQSIIAELLWSRETVCVCSASAYEKCISASTALFVCFFFTFCRIYLDREKCLQFVFIWVCCCYCWWWCLCSEGKGWMALAVTMCVCRDR